VTSGVIKVERARRARSWPSRRPPPTLGIGATPWPPLSTLLFSPTPDTRHRERCCQAGLLSGVSSFFGAWGLAGVL